MSIGGLPGLSGYDFSGIVERLVDVYRLPENQMIQQQNKLEKIKKAWLDVNSKLSALDSKLKALKDSNTWAATKAASSNTNLLNVTTGSGAVPGLYNITINQVATAQTVVSRIQNVSSANTATNVPTGNFNITVNGTTKTISVTSGDSLSTIASKINNQNAGVSASVVQVDGGFQLAISNLKTGAANAATFSDDASGVLWTLGVLDGNGTIKDTTKTVASSIQAVGADTDPTAVGVGSFNVTVGGTTQQIDVVAGESLSSLANKINSSGLGLSASVVPVYGGYQLVITDPQKGTEGAATFAELSGNALQTLGILDANGKLTSASSTGGKTLNAADAQILVNGITNITSTTNSVTTAIPGLTLNLNSADPNSTIAVTVSEDNSIAEKAVQEFVEQYNAVQDFITGKLSYDKDTKVAGDLFGDPMLQGIQSKLRGMMGGMFSNPSGEYNTLKEVGISTSNVNYGKDATLSFNTAKFNEALAKDRQSVANLFGATYGGVTPVNDINDNTLDPDLHQGLGNYLQSYLTPLIKFQGVLSQTQDNLSKQIDNVKDRISDFEERVLAYQERMTKKFAALESVLSNISAQGSWMIAQANALSNQQTSNK